MLVLDTNVLSALMHDQPSVEIVDWLDRQPRLSVWTTAITVMELYHGIERLAAGRKQRRLRLAMQRLVKGTLAGRVAAFDSAAAESAALLMAAGQRAGRPGELRDTMIAGIVQANHATLATRNIRHFADLSVPLVDPWQG